MHYNAIMFARRLAALSCLVLLALALGGCTKCGWLWDDQSHACHSDRVK
ncbi:MAG TPA: peptidylprolyl isomerase [Pseudolabrys sp.]|nr:peptidylprolyl isomerase [Pseudolabrys sp.]